MITVACTKCPCAIRVIGDATEISTLVGAQSSFHPDAYVCYSCGEKAACVLSPEVSALAERNMCVHELTPQEAFAALNGMGVPEEATCCAEVLVPMFASVGIKVTGRQMPNTTRYAVDSLTFPDGRTVHLAASVVGALAYRITHKHSYVSAVEGFDDVI